jgi:hypothetical protein
MRAISERRGGGKITFNVSNLSMVLLPPPDHRFALATLPTRFAGEG